MKEKKCRNPATAARNVEIAERCEAGEAMAGLAREYSLSRSRVAQIVRRFKMHRSWASEEGA